METVELEAQVRAAQAGDRKALEAVVREIQDHVYHLAVRVLVARQEALNATQEVLILVVTKLSTFEHRSAFRTWVYRVAIRYLLEAKRVRDHFRGLTFDAFQQDLEGGLADESGASPEHDVMLNELRISCTMAMLLCLDLESRIAYVLGDILELDHVEASELLGISSVAYRKRLSRARQAVLSFTQKACGLASDDAACHCTRRLPRSIELGRVQRGRHVYDVPGAPSFQDVQARVARMEGELKALTLQASTPALGCPENLARRITEIVDVRE